MAEQKFTGEPRTGGVVGQPNTTAAEGPTPQQKAEQDAIIRDHAGHRTPRQALA